MSSEESREALTDDGMREHPSMYLPTVPRKLFGHDEDKDHDERKELVQKPQLPPVLSTDLHQELRAIGSVSESLEGLDPAARRRVLTWATDRFLRRD